MTDNSIFDNKETNPTDTAVTQSTDIFSDQLKVIKNEQGEPKYKDVASALNGLAHSQEYIRKLEAEKRELETKFSEVQSELQNRASVEDLFKTYTATPQSQEPNMQGDQPKEVVLDEVKVLSLVDQKIQERLAAQTAAQAQEANVATVTKTLTEKFGADAGAKLKARAAELGTTPEQLKILAAQNPNMVLAFFESVGSPKTSPVLSSQTTSIPKATQERVTRNVTAGGYTSKDLIGFVHESRDRVYAAHGITA